MLRPLLAAAALLGLAGTQDMPVARPSGLVPGQAGQASVQPQRSAPLPPLAVSQIDPREITLDSPRRLTLSFAEARPIDEVLSLLTAGTGFSVSIDADATGTFRGELRQLTLRESLSAILAPHGLDFDVRGTLIRVRPRQLQTRTFDLDLLNIRRGLSRVAGNGEASVSTSVQEDDALGGVADGIKSMLSERGTVHVDRRAGVVQVTDFADRLDRVGLYVETVQQRSGRQVRLQAQAFEVTLTDASSIDWRAVRALLGVAPGASHAAFAADPTALRAALAQQGTVRLLWAPEVTTLNNEPALVRMATAGGTALTMTVVPQISADGIVQMSVSHAWEETAGERKEGWFKSTPFARVSEAESVMRVMDGNTALIAGWIRPQEVVVRSSGAFGSSSKRDGHAELVVLLRPTVVTPGTLAAGNRD